jgi:hypothetical protein
MKCTPIGVVSTESPGHDAYYLLDVEDTTIANMAAVEAEFRKAVYRHCETPGQEFCHTVSLARKPFSTSQFIGIAHVRWDV